MKANMHFVSVVHKKLSHLWLILFLFTVPASAQPFRKIEQKASMQTVERVVGIILYYLQNLV